MKGVILTIGDELLIGQVLNSNTQWISQELTDLGIEVACHLTVRDEEQSIQGGLDFLIPKCDYLIIGGGLGPTHDDLTLDALSNYFKIPLQFDQDWLAKLEEFFKSRNREMPENNKKQAYLLKDAIRIDNDCGTAAGQHLRIQETEIFVVPGVPHEMKSMMKRYILPIMAHKNSSHQILKRTLLVTGIGESALATRCDAFVKKVQARSDLSLAFLPSTTDVRLRLQMKSNQPQSPLEFDSLVDELKAYCKSDFYGYEPLTLEELIIKSMSASHTSLALAESCTGGLIAHRLTQIPGSSQVLKGSLVAYQNEIKINELGISAELIEKSGAVSKAVAIAMAETIQKKWKVDLALSTTGFLGPAGGKPNAPVGTVWIALASSKETKALEFHFENHRGRSKERAAQCGLDLLRRSL